MTSPTIPTVVKAVAETENIDPKEVDFVLEQHIDTDALEQLVAHETASWTLSFEVSDHEVTVRGDGTVLVDRDHRRTLDPPHSSIPGG